MRNMSVIPTMSDDLRSLAEEVKAENEAEEKAAEVKPEAKPEAAPAPEPKPEPEQKPKEPLRSPEYVPVKKFNETRHELQEAKRKAEELERKLSEATAARQAEPAQVPDAAALAKQIAERHGNVDENVVLDIINGVRTVGIDPSIRGEIEAVKSLKSNLEAEAARKAAEAAYVAAEQAVTAEFPHLSAYAKELREKAFAEGNESVPLRLLALELSHDLNLDRTRPTAEAGTAAPAAPARKPVSQMSQEELDGLDDAGLDELIELNRKRKGFRL